MHTRMHTASHFIIIIITVKNCSQKQQRYLQSTRKKETIQTFMLSVLYNMLVASYFLKKTKQILTIIFKWSLKL